MAIREQLQRLVDQMPDPDGRGMYTTDIDQGKIEKAVAEMAQGGKEYLLGLTEMLGEPGSVEDAKPHYALHCVVNHALTTSNEKQRKDCCEVLASQLGNEKLSPHNRSYLCQELQWAGRDEACAALGKALLDADLTDAAATALAAIGGERAASQLRAAAGKAQGKALLNLIDALAALADPKSADVFKKAMQSKDRETRIAAAVGLAELGSAEAAEPLLKLSDQASGWERTQTTKACLVLAEQLAAAGKKDDAKRIYERLNKSRSGDNEQHIREAAQRGLAAIA
ncbi:MAG: HEAT repeat domain-containing protein [Planctomycetales bacterium]